MSGLEWQEISRRQRPDTALLLRPHASSPSWDVHSTGYGYDISPGENVAEAVGMAAEFLKKYDDDINWVANEFGKWSTADLELASTIVYIDREFQGLSRSQTRDDLARRVNEVKPQFAVAKISSQIEILRRSGVLHSLANG